MRTSLFSGRPHHPTVGLLRGTGTLGVDPMILTFTRSPLFTISLGVHPPSSVLWTSPSTAPGSKAPKEVTEVTTPSRVWPIPSFEEGLLVHWVLQEARRERTILLFRRSSGP